MNKNKTKDVPAQFSEEKFLEFEREAVQLVNSKTDDSTKERAVEMGVSAEEYEMIRDRCKEKDIWPKVDEIKPLTQKVLYRIAKEGEPLTPAVEFLTAECRKQRFLAEQNKGSSFEALNLLCWHFGAEDVEVFDDDMKRHLRYDHALPLSENRTLFVWKTFNDELEKYLKRRSEFFCNVSRLVIGPIHYDTVKLTKSGLLGPRSQAVIEFKNTILPDLEERGLAIPVKHFQGPLGFSLTKTGVSAAKDICEGIDGAEIRRLKKAHVPRGVRCPFCAETHLCTNYRYEPDCRAIGEMFDLLPKAAENGWTKPFSDHEPQVNCPGCESSLINDDGQVHEAYFVDIE